MRIFKSQSIIVSNMLNKATPEIRAVLETLVASINDIKQACNERTSVLIGHVMSMDNPYLSALCKNLLSNPPIAIQQKSNSCQFSDSHQAVICIPYNL